MGGRRNWVLAILAGVWVAGAGLTGTAGAQQPARAHMGRSVKLRILVDKVMQPEADWHTEEWMVAEAAAAGFNVWSPRLGNDDLVEVAQVSEWCRKQGIYHMPWMRGTLVAPEGEAAAGKRVVWASGSEQLLWSPNSDEFWEWTTRYIVEYARMAAADSTMLGVFLDYENYAPGTKGGNLYDLSYDDLILADYARSRDVEMPHLELADRRPWLEAQGLHEDFAEYQIAHWRQRCRALREAVDAHAPEFQFCIYPAPGTLFMTAATYPEWATAAAPLILADASIYGRPGLWSEHAAALEANRAMLSERMAWACDEPGGPYMYAGGLDPVVDGADPEFSGRNAAMSSELTDGYWIFYEGPTYDGTHRDYFNWFTRANAAIEAGEWGFWREPRKTPDTFGLTELVAETNRPQLVVHGAKAPLLATLEAMDLFEIHAMAGSALSYLRGADVVLLQNFNESFDADHQFVGDLRAYVESAGGLLLGHDTAWFMASPFEDVATRGYPQHSVEAERHVVRTDLITATADAALGQQKAGTRFSTEFYDHMIFQVGPAGRVLVRNVYGDPVYVVAEAGKGRVVFSGCYYGYSKPLEGVEAEVFASVLRWLARED